MDIKGHAALVTGGGSGLGAATAQRLAAAGARVALLDVNIDGARALARELGGLAVRCDVADPDSAAAAVAEARAAHGPARVLVNCAGIGVAKRILGRDGPQPLGDFERVVRVNLLGSFNMLRLAASDMSALEPLEDGERGVVVSTASVAAFEGQVGQAAYAASKGGVASMTLPAARELAQFGIRVMAIAPGLFLTPMMQGLPEEVQVSLGASIPFPRRLGKPEEIAYAVAFLVDEQAAWITGSNLDINGGHHMGW